MSEQDKEGSPSNARLIGAVIFAVLFGSTLAAPTYAVLHFTFGLGVPLSAALAVVAGTVSIFLTFRSKWGWWLPELIAEALAMVFRWM